jgi:hypothetical protein
MGLEKIAGMFLNIFKPVTRQTELEKYLDSMKPQSAADVEYYVKKFDREAGGKAIWWP